MNDYPEIDKKQWLDPKVFEKAIKIIKSKPKKPKEEFFSRQAMRYEVAINTYDVVGCGKIINELKPYFDGTLENKKEKKKDSYISYEALFLKAVRNIAQLISYHNGEKKHWENTENLLNMLNIPMNILDLETHGHIFSQWSKQ